MNKILYLLMNLLSQDQTILSIIRLSILFIIFLSIKDKKKLLVKLDLIGKILDFKEEIPGLISEVLECLDL
jgi:hypothetical protein